MYFTKNLTSSDVEKTVRELIRMNGSTTTLEVKNALRRDGFYATQTAVSTCMADMAANNEINYNDNGSHRIYTMPVMATTITVATGYSHDLNARGICKNCGCSKEAINHFKWVCGIDTKTRVSATSRIINRQSKVGRYAVRDVSGILVRVYENVTRGEAKHRWATETKRDFFAARTVRLD